MLTVHFREFTPLSAAKYNYPCTPDIALYPWGPSRQAVLFVIAWLESWIVFVKPKPDSLVSGKPDWLYISFFFLFFFGWVGGYIYCNQLSALFCVVVLSGRCYRVNRSTFRHQTCTAVHHREPECYAKKTVRSLHGQGHNGGLNNPNMSVFSRYFLNCWFFCYQTESDGTSS